MLRATLRTLIFVSCAIGLTDLVLCQGLRSLKFEPVEGISQSWVTGIVQDRYGYMWFATHDGLNRYDGYEFTIFRHNPSEPSSLAGNWIAALGCTSSGRVWVVHGIGGLSLYRPGTRSFLYFSADRPDSLRLTGSTISAVMESPDGTLWVGTPGAGLNRILLPPDEPPGKERLRVERFRHVEDNPFALPSDTVVSLAAAEDGMVWVASPGSVSRFDANSGAFVQHPRPAGSRPILGLIKGSDNSLWVATSAGFERLFTPTGAYDEYPLPVAHSPIAVQEDSTGGFWVATDRGSLLRFAGERFQMVYPPKEGLRRFGSPQVLAMGKGGSLLAGMSGGGALRVDSTGDLAAILRVPIPEEQTGATISTIHEDRSGTLWAGTAGAGLWKFNPYTNKFLLVRPTGEPGGLPHPSVTAFARFGESEGRAWIGTAGEGLCVYDVEEERFLSTAELPVSARAFRGSSLNVLHSAGDTLWVGTQNEGLFMLSGGTIRSFTVSPNAVAGPSTNTILTLYSDDARSLWIGTGGGGLHRLDLRSGLFTRYPFLPATMSGLGAPSVWALHRDRAGVFWFGLAAGGLEAGMPDTDGSFRELRSFAVDPQVTCRLNSRTVTAIHESHGALWFGTYSGGLNRFSDSCFTHITVDEGLPGNLINGIAEDGKGIFWVSTNRGIARLDPATGEVRRYDRSDGLQSDEFNRGAILHLPNGAILMGGVNGFNVIRPGRIPESRIPPPVVITRFSVHNADHPIAGPLEELRSVSLSYDQNSFAFEFVALDHTNPEKNRYAYILEGLEREWTQAGYRRYARYTNLDPGEYRFRVRAANSDGVWNYGGHTVQIVIHPPFWKTWWFTTILGAVAGLLIWLVYTWRVRSKVQKTLEMERIRVEEAEKVRAETARDFHDEMGHRLTRITMLSETARLQLESGITEPLLKKNLETIGENARSLYQGTRDFLWALDPHHDTLYEVALRLKDFGEELFDGTDVSFQTQGIEPELERARLTMDVRRNLQLIFKEVLHNVLKHARCRSAVLSAEIQRDVYILLVSDDGEGFDTEKQAPGSGLRGIRTRATRIGGDLAVTSGSSGTAVRFTGKIPQSGGLSEER